MICRIDDTGGSGNRTSCDIDTKTKEKIKEQVRREIQKYVISKRKDNWIMRYLEGVKKWQ